MTALMDDYTMFREGDAREFVIYRPGGVVPVFRMEARHHRLAKTLLENLNNPDYVCPA